MLLNDFDIQMASVFKNDKVYSNPRVLRDVIEALYCKDLIYTVDDICVVFESKNFKKGDIIFILKDEFKRDVKGCITYNALNKCFVSYLFQNEKSWYKIPKEVIACINPCLSRHDSVKTLQKSVQSLLKSKDNNDVQWGIKMDSILAFMEYEDNKEEIMRNDEVIDRAKKCINDYIDNKYFTECKTKNFSYSVCLN